jgi:hypothetical protein
MNTTLGITNDNFNTTLTAGGNLGFLWDSPTPVTLSDNTKLFTISYKAKLNGTANISINDDPVTKYFENKDKLQLNILVTNGSVTVPTLEENINTKVIVFPNPTNEFINFESEILIKDLEILNSTGKNLMNIDNLNEAKGIIDLSKLSTGIYILKLKTDDGDIYKKISLIKYYFFLTF